MDAPYINTAPISAYMQRHGLTLEEFAEIAGVSSSMVSQWLAGKKGMRPRTARRIEQSTRGEIKVRAIFRELLAP